MRRPFRTFTAEDAGASAVEYALLISGVAVIIVLSVFAFGGMVRALHGDNCETIAATASPGYTCDR